MYQLCGHKQVPRDNGGTDHYPVRSRGVFALSQGAGLINVVIHILKQWSCFSSPRSQYVGAGSELLLRKERAQGKVGSSRRT